MELPPIWRGWDLGLELADDDSAAAWVVEALRPWERPRGGSVWIASFVPDSFEAYARILHPARGPDGDVCWAELAARRGVAVGPETGFCAASGLDHTADQRTWDEAVPSDGSLPERQLAALGEALAPFTSRPESCFYCFWVGWGAWGGGATLTLDPRISAAENEAINRESRARAECERGQLDRLPLVRVPNREHYLFTGPLARMGHAVRLEHGYKQSPSMWWPADRAWFVSTEIDGHSTYVGATAACVDAVLGHPDLEALTVTVDSRMDPGPYA